VATEPVPPVVPRSDALGTLKRERWFATDAGETERVAQIDAQIARLSAASSATTPLRETTAATAPARRNTARTNPKGSRRVRTAR
jgi:hypothetical protein